MVRVAGDRIINREHYLIRPARNSFFFTPIHGISWEHVREKPTFEELWPRIQKLLVGAEFIASHNVGFDRRVLESCCQAAKIPRPEIRFVCTMKLARRLWNIRPTSLSNVCSTSGFGSILTRSFPMPKHAQESSLLRAGLELQSEEELGTGLAIDSAGKPPIPENSG